MRKPLLYTTTPLVAHDGRAELPPAFGNSGGTGREAARSDSWSSPLPMGFMTFCIACAWTTLLAAAAPDTVPARVTTGDAVLAVTLRDQPLHIRTVGGSLVLPLRDVHAISRSPLEMRARVETAGGDVWLVELRNLSGDLEVLDGADYRRLAVDPPEFDRIEISPQRAEQPALGMVRVHLIDAQQVVVSPDNWIFDIPDGDSQWSLPMGALLSMARPEATEAPSAGWIVRFPSGVQAELPEPPRNRQLPATDRHANLLKLPLREILRLDMVTSAGPDGDAAPGVSPTGPDTNAPPPATDMPFAIVRVTGTLGTVLLPAAMLNGVAPQAGGGVQATTVYGEQFLGAIAPESLTLRNVPGRGAVTVALSRDSLAFEPPRHLPLPPGALLWQLTDGSLVAARFADDTLELAANDTEPPVAIPTRTIVSVLNHGERLTVGDDRNALLYGRPAIARVALVLQTTGMRCEIPWAQVGAIDRRAPAPAPGGLADAGPRDGMRRIAGGTFLMGRARGEGLPDELPPHAVSVRDFFIDPYEITRAQFAEFVAATQHRTEAEQAGLPTTWREPGFLQRSDEPVVWVTWRDAAHFCNWRSTAAGLTPSYTFARRGDELSVVADSDGYRLPTEAEWEYAARNGGDDRLFPWGDDTSASNLPARANYRATVGAPEDDWLWTNPVRAFPPNELGLFGMAGNVWEWCEDWYFDRAYVAVHRQRPADPCVRTGDIAGLSRRVMRGGCFDNELDLLRCAARGHGLPQASANRVGFRCARTAPPGEPKP